MEFNSKKTKLITKISKLFELHLAYAVSISICIVLIGF